ncbi:hypothetical protein KJ611_03700 [Patescibacteria group bacterium]|nr:hypothetical protein [Patescibacteria group bacterium]MBU1705265.1 hypothetical protein [Patescibacteria group bacterium]
MEEIRLQKRPRSALSVEQKVAFVLLLILGMGGLILGMLSFGANIRRPFDIQLANYTGEPVYGTDEMERRELAALKNKDSDQDGLSDYDELYVFKTSPYLSDSDSDGIDDRTEIFAGEDPNCPSGKECGAFFAGEETSQGETATSLLPPLTTTPAAGSFGNVTLESPQDILEYFQSLSTDEIRDMLKQQGVPAETLDELDDASLRELIESSLTKAMAENQFDQFLTEEPAQY